MVCEKEEFPHPFVILLTQWHKLLAPKLTNFRIFIIPLFLNVALFSKSSYLIAHFKRNYETGYIRRFSEKTQACIQDHWDSWSGAFCGISRCCGRCGRCCGSPKCASRKLKAILKFVQLTKLSIAELQPATFLNMIYFTDYETN